MANHIRKQKIVMQYVVRGRTLDVQLTTWDNDPGLSYDVRDRESGFALHNESFDNLPTQDQVRDLIAALQDNGADADPGFFDPAEVAAFLASLGPDTAPPRMFTIAFTEDSVHCVRIDEEELARIKGITIDQLRELDEDALREGLEDDLANLQHDGFESLERTVDRFTVDPPLTEDEATPADDVKTCTLTSLQWEALTSALGDAHAYRTNSGEGSYDSHDQAAAARTQALADALGVTLE